MSEQSENHEQNEENTTFDIEKMIYWLRTKNDRFYDEEMMKNSCLHGEE